MSDSFFTIVSHDADGVVWFDPTEHARGPWAADACHAGPPTGLLARASELAVPDQQLMRLTVDLVRPIPHQRFGILSTVTRRGRSVSTTELTIVDTRRTPVVTARGMHIATAPDDDFPTAPASGQPILADAQPGRFPVMSSTHGQAMFGNAVEVRYPPDVELGPGPTTLWMRTPPLLDGEAGSGFQRICPLADCGNGISSNAGVDRFMFINTDLTISLHRPPVGEWFASSAVSYWEPNGVGASDAHLFDQLGPVGRATQSMMIRPR